MPGLENIAVFIGLTVVVFGGAAILGSGDGVGASPWGPSMCPPLLGQGLSLLCSPFVS